MQAGRYRHANMILNIDRQAGRKVGKTGTQRKNIKAEK